MSKTKNYRELVNEAINISKQADASYSHERLLELLKQSKTLTIQALDSGWPEEDGRELSIEGIIKNITNGYLPLSVVINLAKSGSEAADDILVRLLDVKGTSIESLEAIDKYLEESREENTATETNSSGSGSVATTATTNNKATPKSTMGANRTFLKKNLSTIVKNLFMSSGLRTKSPSSRDQTHSTQGFAK